MRSYVVQGITLEVGENRHENWKLIDKSQQAWWWLHLNSFPSGHVVIQHDEPPQNIIDEAAYLCLFHTKFRNMKNVKACFTQINNLKKTENVGEVEFASNKKVKYTMVKSIF